MKNLHVRDAAVALAIILTSIFTGCQNSPTRADRIAEETADRPAYWHTVYVQPGMVKVVCDNGGDATIRPVETFGQIIVDCGEK